MIKFPKSRVDRFRHTNAHKRWGQAFYDWMRLDKVRDAVDKAYCDRIYTATDAEARQLVASRLDHAH